MGRNSNESNAQQNLLQEVVESPPAGHYSGDKPNLTLRGFVEEHLRQNPYCLAGDTYSVPAFNKPIETTKATAAYNIHTYWSKKPHDAIREYIRHYTKPGDLVLDPFSGSGGTALAALSEGRKAISIDRSPAATFITYNYSTLVDVEALDAAAARVLAGIADVFQWLYETTCDKCGGKAKVTHTVYSQRFKCPRCLAIIPLFECVETEGQTKAGKPKTIQVCPHCWESGNKEEISTRGENFGIVPVLVGCVCVSQCKKGTYSERKSNDPDPIKREQFIKQDRARLAEIEHGEIPYWYPEADLASVIPYRMLCKKDFRPSAATRLSQFFTKRNLWAMAALRHQIVTSERMDPRVRQALLFAFTGFFWG